jgi:hypothetical protein
MIGDLCRESSTFGLYLGTPTGLRKSGCWKRGSTWILDARVALVEEPKIAMSLKQSGDVQRLEW